MTDVHEGPDGLLHVYLDVVRADGHHEEIEYDEEAE